MSDKDNNDFNIARNRYYGVRIGDTVRYGIPGFPDTYDVYTVVGYFELDNNRVVLKNDATGEKKEAVAEYCEVIRKVEDKEND